MKRIDDFSKLVGQYCLWTDSLQKEDTVDLGEVLALLSELFNKALSLPLCESSETDEDAERLNHDEWKLKHKKYGSTQPAKETRTGHVGLESYDQTSLRVQQLGLVTGNWKIRAEASATEEPDVVKRHAGSMRGAPGNGRSYREMRSGGNPSTNQNIREVVKYEISVSCIWRRRRMELID